MFTVNEDEVEPLLEPPERGLLESLTSVSFLAVLGDAYTDVGVEVFDLLLLISLAPVELLSLALSRFLSLCPSPVSVLRLSCAEMGRVRDVDLDLEVDLEDERGLFWTSVVLAGLDDLGVSVEVSDVVSSAVFCLRRAKVRLVLAIVTAPFPADELRLSLGLAMDSL